MKKRNPYKTAQQEAGVPEMQKSHSSELRALRYVFRACTA